MSAGSGPPGNSHTLSRVRNVRARNLMLKLLMCCGLWLLAGCNGRQRSAGPEQGAGDLTQADLSTSLEVKPGADSVGFTLHVTNAATRPITLEFATGQRYDFEVRELDGRQVWRWGADRMFTESLGKETLSPGASVAYTAEWRTAGRSGSFLAIGRVTTSSRAIEQQVTFELPKK